MKPSASHHITIGKVGAPYGVHGWVKIHTYTEHHLNILNYSPWYLSSDDKTYQTCEIEDGKEHNNTVIVKFKNINSPEAARLLTGKFITIDSAQLPKLKKDEYYWSDLIGLKVINKDGQGYGEVAYLMATGSNDVLVVKNKKEHAIPFILGSVILKVDLEKREIHVDWELI